MPAIRQVQPGHQVLVVPVIVGYPGRLLLRGRIPAGVVIIVSSLAAGCLCQQLVGRVVLVVCGLAVEHLVLPVARGVVIPLPGVDLPAVEVPLGGELVPGIVVVVDGVAVLPLDRQRVAHRVPLVSEAGDDAHIALTVIHLRRPPDGVELVVGHTAVAKRLLADLPIEAIRIIGHLAEGVLHRGHTAPGVVSVIRQSQVRVPDAGQVIPTVIVEDVAVIHVRSPDPERVTM